MNRVCFMLIGRQSDEDEVELLLFEDEDDAQKQASDWVEDNKYSKEKISLIKTFVRHSSKQLTARTGGK